MDDKPLVDYPGSWVRFLGSLVVIGVCLGLIVWAVRAAL